MEPNGQESQHGYEVKWYGIRWQGIVSDMVLEWAEYGMGFPFHGTRVLEWNS